MAVRSEVETREDSHLTGLLGILGRDKIIIVKCPTYSLRIINGSIGNDLKQGEFVNVEVDFEDHQERFRVYPFGVNRVIDSRLGLVVRDIHSVVLETTVRWGQHISEGSRPMQFLDHSGWFKKVSGFVHDSLKNGLVRRFREGQDFRQYYRELNDKR